MRRALFLTIAFVLAFAHFGACFAEDDYYLRDYDGVEISKGTFIPVICAQEISSAYSDEGTPVKFISTTDLFLYETTIIPKNTEFFGFVEKINEPVIGTNGSIVIAVNKMRFVDGFEMPIKAHIYTPNNNILGGELTKPATYDKMPHRQEGFYLGTLQYVPGSTRKMGEHTVVSSGADLMIILARPIYITHTLTN